MNLFPLTSYVYEGEIIPVPINLLLFIIQYYYFVQNESPAINSFTSSN